MERHECNVCYETKQCITLQCEHRLCRYCVIELTSNNYNCPMCNKKIVLLNKKFNLLVEQYHHGNENVNLNLRYVHLTYEDNFHQEIYNLPNSITHLTFKDNFHQEIYNLPDVTILLIPNLNQYTLQNILNNIFKKSIIFKNLSVNSMSKIINCFNFKNLFH